MNKDMIYDLFLVILLYVYMNIICFIFLRGLGFFFIRFSYVERFVELLYKNELF